ncbi:hypothetical protein M885DRAFT_552402 [Pelagophyceae sp. CCMP2097]|nr:hypothetical protein M885DRAFT_552402 [Pelagophyceae sp. CCMP2097]
MAAHAAKAARASTATNDATALAGLRKQALYRKNLAYQDGDGCTVGSCVLVPVDNVQDRHALDDDFLCCVCVSSKQPFRVAASVHGPLVGTYAADQIKYAPAYQDPVLYGLKELHSHVMSLSADDLLTSFLGLPKQTVRQEHFGDTRGGAGGRDAHCTCSKGKESCKSKACSCRKANVTCSSKCHGGRGSTKSTCYTMPCDDEDISTPGAFATLHRSGGGGADMYPPDLAERKALRTSTRSRPATV